jgi:deoxyadenosine/deoxycytidine kinase
MNDKNEFDYEDYFFTKYSSDIIDLFSEIKEISNGFCINMFNSRYQNQFGSCDLQEFLFDKIILIDEITDNTDNSDNNLHETEYIENNM